LPSVYPASKRIALHLCRAPPSYVDGCSHPQYINSSLIGLLLSPNLLRIPCLQDKYPPSSQLTRRPLCSTMRLARAASFSCIRRPRRVAIDVIVHAVLSGAATTRGYEKDRRDQ
jgi:hypothetical protein